MSKYTFANLLNGETSGKMSLETFMDYLKKEHAEGIYIILLYYLYKNKNIYCISISFFINKN